MARQSSITDIKARQIFDSRGNPTVEVDVITELGTFRAAVPSGASTGIYEALELRDGGSKYMGKGVSKAINNILTVIKPALLGKDPIDQKGLDELMYQQLDGTKGENGWMKSKLGANAILGVSMAICRAGAYAHNMPLYKYIAKLAGRPIDGKFYLPVPFFNVINGGEHAGNELAVQEFMICPVGAQTFEEAMQMGTEVYHTLKSLLNKTYGVDATNVGDEGGFAPAINDTEEALRLLNDAIKQAGYEGKIKIALDVAASEFATDDKPPKYNLAKKAKNATNAQLHDGASMIDLYRQWAEKYNIVSIEDPFEQDDWENTKEITTVMGKSTQIVGDDILVTNPVRVSRGIETKTCNALLLKVNQIGTVTESIEAVLMAQKAGWGIMTSHRSGETEDTFIADLAVGLGTKQIKTGGPSRSERLAKYNQLLRIEQELGENARYPGTEFRQPPVY